MNRRLLLRLISALAAVFMFAQPVLAEVPGEEPAQEAPAIETLAEQADAGVEESGELTLGDEADGTFDGEAAFAADTAPAESADAQAEAPAAPDAEAPAADPGRRVFDSTVEVNGETWQGVDLARAEGFAGKLAAVSGTLTLSGVTIEGQPARSVNLLDYFDLNAGAAIAIQDDAALTLSLSAASVNLGSALSLKAFYNGGGVKADRVKWKSSAKSLAKVGKKGRVAAKQRGTAVITASYKGQTACCYLDITGAVLPKSVKLNKKKLTLGLNGTAALKATLKPANPDDPTLTWASSKPEIVGVDDQGNVTGLAAGRATVYVSTVNGKSAACKVTVKNIRPKSLSFKKLYVTLHPGESYQSVLKLNPANSSNPEVTYVTSDSAVAAVDENGLITAAGCGTVTITAAFAANPRIANTCKVCVIPEGAARMEGLIIGINPGHQRTMIRKRYPMAPGSHSYGPGVKVGATGCSTHQTEYSVVLSVGLKLKRILEENGAKVVITRTTNDVMLTNIDRAKMLNAAGVDAALQLHCNSCSNAGKTGSSSYFRTTGEWGEENRALAIQISKHMSKATGFHNRGINPYNDYMSLNWTTTPSVLLEMGYLSNSSDDHKLAKDSFREKLAEGIYEGLCAYFGR